MIPVSNKMMVRHSECRRILSSVGGGGRVGTCQSFLDLVYLNIDSRLLGKRNWYIYNKSKQNRLEVPFSPVIMDDKNDGYQKKFPDPPG